MALDLSTEQIRSLGQILMGAALADGELAGSEVEAIEEILGCYLDGAVLDTVADELGQFDAETFDLAAACAHLGELDAEDRRIVLAMLSEVVDADDLYDADGEEGYIRQVARFIGATDREIAQVTIDIAEARAEVPELIS